MGTVGVAGCCNEMFDTKRPRGEKVSLRARAIASRRAALRSSSVSTRREVREPMGKMAWGLRPPFGSGRRDDDDANVNGQELCRQKID